MEIGTPARKIEAETNWFKQLPAQLKRFTPQLISSGYTEQNKPFYETEYLPILPLNEIFVHGKNPITYWEKILSLISYYMNVSRKCFPMENNAKIEKIRTNSTALYADKPMKDWRTMQKNQINLDEKTRYSRTDLPSLREIAKECIEATLALPEVPAITHGDLCFSNIIYDARSNNIKVIDP